MGLIAGLSFNLAEPASTVAGYAALAEGLGFQGPVLLTDSQLLWRDVYVALTLTLERTRRLRLGPGVTNPITRHITVTASAMATLEELAPGRLILGLGAGDSALLTLHRGPASLKQLREALLALKGLLRGEEVRLADGSLRLPWARPLPIYLASTGPNSLRLAGELADGVLINVGAHEGLIAWALERLEEGAIRAGRDLRELDIWVRLTCYPCDDEARAREVVRAAAASKANGLARYARDEGFKGLLPKELLQDLRRVAEGYDYREHQSPQAKHARLVSDRIIEALVIAGEPSYCRARLKGIMESTGVNQFSFATYGFPSIPGFLSSFEREILRPLA